MKLHTLLLLFLPFLLTAGVDQATDTLPTPHKYRVGVSYAHEGEPNFPFVLHRGVMTGVPSRDLLIELYVDRYLTKWNPTLAVRAEVRASYQQMNFIGVHNPVVSTFFQFGIDPFSERIEYSAFQIGAGLSLEPIAPTKFGPYLSINLLLAIPTELSYQMDGPVSENELSGTRSITGGGVPSPGWAADAGVRILPHERICVKLGGYINDQRIRVDWPALEGRDLGGTIMALRSLGFKAAVQYCW